MIEGQGTGGPEPVLTYGMIGGGPGAFIGDVHRKALAMDGRARPAAGCFSQKFENTLETGRRLGVDETRLYRNYREMIQAERRREDRLDFVIIVTPNDTHFPMAEAALRNGFHVVCDKPLTTDSGQARKLADLSAEMDRMFLVTYAYTGYPVTRHIRDTVAGGGLGDIRFVHAEYPQDWLATSLEKTGQKQSMWRTDPRRAGISNCVGDIGSHVENMVGFMTGLKISRLCARLDKFGPGRTLDDNASILVDYEGGARGIYWSSQIAVGHDNSFRVRVYGTRGSVEWCQESPDTCRFGFIDRPTEIFSRGRGPMSPAAQRLSRIPSGHPEGYFEAFANIYSVFCRALSKKKAGLVPDRDDLDFPGLQEGLRGVRFIEKCVESSGRGAVWVDFD